ncbi:UDP-N-acetylmuramate--L-alanine ligase [Flavobacterium sediminis]|uniref:UDP-N-acetylmuramate--L-alanine ligase n=1 Tax=Flavobacterium sediminis TaxID=2201181 RepID=A0A2U8QV62_9FLAO|nr:UDP-N-acetylmuramate--L-alanine ligase [Flavobacterium sediminis]AWM14090.1 UDP-N-acetylmuramate--L-alanine ligase [Flavobacterium sediminis]
MNSNQIQNVYFIGIGGIGMSALARYFMHIGKNVAGYDKTHTQLTDELEDLGMHIHFEDNVDRIEKKYLEKETTLVVVTPAIPKNHSEWNYFLSHGFEIRKRAEVLGIITKDTFCFAVAGTHGKTTTSSILGHILYQSGIDVTAFLGGIVEGYNSNLIGSGKTVTVVEADEFDRSFLHLHPNLACVTSMDADHLDIYGNVESIEESFRMFANKVNPEHLFVPLKVNLKGNTIGIDERADYEALNIRILNGFYHFDVQTPSKLMKDVKFGLPGRHNLSNALIALAMAEKYGVSEDGLKAALETFRGVRRRFSFQVRNEKRVYVDDYAHHPTEIEAVHNAVRELYPGKKVLAVFQPHLFSRTRDFMEGFTESLSKFDEIVLLDIYPARELPIEGITSEVLLTKIENPNKKLVGKETLFEVFQQSDAEVFITIGAGDIGEMVKDLKKVLDDRTQMA